MQQINHFFEIYARALENFDTKGLAFLYNIPCTMLSDEATSAFTDAGKLEGFFNQGTAFYRQFGIVKIRHDIWNRRDLTDRIMGAKVNWRFFDALDQPVYNCDYHYVLRLDKNEMWKIILSVSVNEKQRLEEWRSNVKMR